MKTAAALAFLTLTLAALGQKNQSADDRHAAMDTR